MEKVPQDWDIATDALPEQVIKLFPHVIPTGLKHGTVTVLSGGEGIEVTTFRVEGSYADSRHPEIVSFSDSLIEDLGRRDFTVNAMAMELSGIIHDPFGGREDIERRRIVCVGDPDIRFGEDALRMLRAFRFCAVTGFSADLSVIDSARRNHRLCARLSAERVCAELQKILPPPVRSCSGRSVPWGLSTLFCKKPKPYADFGALCALPSSPELRWAGFAYILLTNGIISDCFAFLKSKRLPSKLISSAGSGAELCAALSQPEDSVGWKRLLASKGVSSAMCAAACWDCAGSQLGAVSELSFVIASGEPFFRRYARG
jgi:tRNA nucleotidyltransferase (CCA-adding enzyme)